MNYRHAFHAGNFADVMKHAILARLIDYLKRKDAAFRVIDTHAGIGRYDLTGEEAQRSPEWRNGVARVLDATLPQDAAELLAPYLDAVRAENPDNELRTYPGSPLIARRLFRPQDRLSVLELHPADAAQLKTLFAGDIQARVSALDGWLALNAYVPPKERRGLVLVDPPFEAEGEWERLADGLARAHRKWSSGMFALWYPLKAPDEVSRFIKALRTTGMEKMLRAELTVGAPSRIPWLYGSGMIVVNPPYTLEQELNILLPALAVAMAAANGGSRVEWIRGEA